MSLGWDWERAYFLRRKDQKKIHLVAHTSKKKRPQAKGCKWGVELNSPKRGGAKQQVSSQFERKFGNRKVRPTPGKVTRRDGDKKKRTKTSDRTIAVEKNQGVGQKKVTISRVDRGEKGTSP